MPMIPCASPVRVVRKEASTVKAVKTGGDNALDEEPPFAIGDADTDLYGYVAGIHDPRGQFFYGKLTYRF